MANLPGRIVVPSSAAQIRDDFLADVRLAAIAAGVTNPPVQPLTDWYVLGTGLANMNLVLYANISIAADQQSDLTATGEQLDKIRASLGLPVVESAPSSGNLTLTTTGAAVNIPDGTQFVLPNGLRGKSDGAKLMPATVNPELRVVTIDKGSKTRFPAGSKVKLVSPPPGVYVDAKVSAYVPLSGGVDDENDARKRDRILNHRQNPPAGGNWGQLREEALNALATLQTAFVFPALGGPASVKVVLVKGFDRAALDWSRTLTLTSTQLVRQAIQSFDPSQDEVVVQSVASQPVDAAVLVKIPDASVSGGDGSGWTDATPWPSITGFVYARISVVTDSSHITSDAGTAVSPIAGQTHIAWWSSVDQKFSTRLITAVAGGAGAWVLTLDSPITDSLGNNPIVGEYLSPAATNLTNYGEAWLNALEAMGPGENTAAAYLLPRALRHPYQSASWPSALNITQLMALRTAGPEITDAAWSYRSVSAPTVPATIDLAPNVLTPRHFGVYQL